MKLFAPIQNSPMNRRAARRFEGYGISSGQHARRLRSVVVAAGLAGMAFGRREESEIVAWLDKHCQASVDFRVARVATDLRDYIEARGGDLFGREIRFRALREGEPGYVA